MNPVVLQVALVCSLVMICCGCVEASTGNASRVVDRVSDAALGVMVAALVVGVVSGLLV